MSTFIIAEAGVNHNGDVELAKRLVDVAVTSGADAIKFQTFKAEECTTAAAKKAQYQQENTGGEENQFDMIKKLELSYEAFEEIKSYCDSQKIEFISTPDGLQSLEYLMKLQVDRIKIGSTEVTNYPFLKAIAEKQKPIILSTGMSTLGEVETAIEHLLKTGNHQIMLMHCTTDYPTQIEDVNLRAMVTMREAFKVPVGLSDHTLTNEAAIAAVALGAVVIEKHITLDKTLEGPDHKASMEPREFKKYVEAIRSTEKLLGNGVKQPTSRERIMMAEVRRSMVAAKDLPKGTKLQEHMLTFKRPGWGIAPKFLDVVIGSTTKNDIAKDELIQWQDIMYL
jgi:N-acetylneuraminate synthase/N,N'-diacetyllegionaminate synthase